MPIKSLYSIKSKVGQNISEEIDILMEENNDLKANLGDLSK
jgi:hypothetical protein